MYLVERGRGGSIVKLTKLDPGMSYNATQPEAYKQVTPILLKAARTSVTLLQGIERKLKRMYHDLGEAPGVGSIDRVLADKLRDLASGFKIVYVQSRNNAEDLAIRRQFLMFGVTGGRRTGMYVEFAFVFTPHGYVPVEEKVDAFLETAKATGRIDYTVVCDRSNNSDDDIANNRLVMDLEIMPHSEEHAKQLREAGWSDSKE